MEYNNIYEIRKAWCAELGIDASAAQNIYEVSLLLLNYYSGGTPVPPTPPTPSYQGLCFTALEDNCSVALTSNKTQEIYKSTDGTNWESWDGSAVSMDNGNKLYLKGAVNNVSRGYTAKFDTVGKVNASGNIMAIFDNGACTATTVQNRELRYFFADCQGLEISGLTLPATTVGYNSYLGMFSGCTSITMAPQLPALTLDGRSYVSMFEGCTSLTTAPELPATSLSTETYSNMFRGCTSLTHGPSVLPATTLYKSSYSYMFSECSSLSAAPILCATTLYIECCEGMFFKCTSLTEAPELLAKTLQASCYRSMFNGCSSLNKLTIYADEKIGYLPTEIWLKDVASAGDFYNYGAATYAINNGSGIPEGWTEHTSLPYSGLTLTALEDGCTIGATGNASLNKSTDGENWDAWDMSNITLNSGESVYFASSLSGGEGLHFVISGSVNAHGNVMSLIDNGACTATTMHEDGLRELFRGCTGLETSGLTLPATTLAERCYWCMFAGCTSLTKAPELPATTMETWCYYGIFSGCTSLTEAPVLPATNLADVCYEGMFRGCTSLNKIVTYASGTIGYKAMTWLAGASPTGDFYNLGGATFQSGDSGIPTGWTEHNSL